ncbi:MAG: S8 family serine peptidase, partial [Puniceicoccales bacterium]|nr:S8 family serine peptidase [Puniceicoccales bacterium]
MSKLPLSLLIAGAAMISTEALAATYGPSFYPNDPYFAYNKTDLPNFAGQWHLVNTAPNIVGTMNAGNANLDVNIKGAWAMGVTGRGVVIGIIDDGVEGDHEDLAPNYRADLSKIFSQNPTLAESVQRPVQPSNNHGVAAAGVAAARGGNGIGVTGAAPFAGIAGQRVNLILDGTTDDPGATVQDVADAFLWKSGVAVDATTGHILYGGEAEIHVKNNSWVVPRPFDAFDGTHIFDKESASLKALSLASANNVIFVFSAGNERGGLREQSQTDTHNSSEPAIDVAALGSDGLFSAYSCFGPNIFVTAPSNSKTTTFGITTTDRSGSDFGYNTYVAPEPSATPTVSVLTDLPNANYTSIFSGTSSAAPLVSGIIALGKQVAPAMDVRLAKHVLVKSSHVVDAEENSLSSGGRGWQKNAAGNWFNPNYGFGLIDATAFVNKVIESAYVTDRTAYDTGTVNVSTPILVGDPNGVVRKFTISPEFAKQPIETVETQIKVTG